MNGCLGQAENDSLLGSNRLSDFAISSEWLARIPFFSSAGTVLSQIPQTTYDQDKSTVEWNEFLAVQISRPTGDVS